MSWHALEEAATQLAAFGAGRLDGRVAYLATVDQRGAPRVHPVTPIVARGHLFVFMEPTSPKGQDLERGSRYALHCGVEDAGGGRGEFRVRGTGQPVTDEGARTRAVQHASYVPHDDYVLFELFVDDAFSTLYGEDGSPIRQHWRREPS